MLLVAALYWQRQQRAPRIVTICPHCADLVEHAPGLPYACPSCCRWWIG